MESLSFKNTFERLVINSAVLDSVQTLHYLIASLMVKLWACLKT